MAQHLFVPEFDFYQKIISENIAMLPDGTTINLSHEINDPVDINNHV